MEISSEAIFITEKGVMIVLILTSLNFIIFLIISDSLSSITPSSSAISAIVEKSSLENKLVFFDLFISFVKN